MFLFLFSTRASCVRGCRVYSMILCLVFFFFKQKTAYEMRISDWSSDVCSSDLFLGIHAAAGEIEVARQRRADQPRQRMRSAHVARQADLRERDRKSVV